MRRRMWAWLHRHGIARIVNIQYPSSYLLEAKPWTPEWLVRWQVLADCRLQHPSIACSQRLGSLTRGERTAAGTVHWRARFVHAGPR